jgi:hypothetical protein
LMMIYLLTGCWFNDTCIGKKKEASQLEEWKIKCSKQQRKRITII